MLSYCADLVRRSDPDRYVMAMLAPAARRAPLLALYAFNTEIARIRESVSERALGEIRLQWWRDTIDAAYAGREPRHGVGPALAAAISEYGLTRDYFEQLIDARGGDLDDNPPATMEGLIDYAGATTGPLNWLALEVLGQSTPVAREAAWNVGVAWSLVGLVRALPFHLRAGRLHLPPELTLRHDVDLRGLLALEPSPNLNTAVADLADIVASHIRRSRTNRRDISRRAVPALLAARFAERYLVRLAAADCNPFDPRLAVQPPMIAWSLMLGMLGGRY